MKKNESLPAQSVPRPPNAEEQKQLAEWLGGQGYEKGDAIGTVQGAYVAVYDDYCTGCPGYCGKVLSVVWDGSPSSFDVFTWENDKLQRSGRDYDEKACDRCGKNGVLCVNCWRRCSNQTHKR